MATGGDHCGASASQMPMVCAREVFDERPRDDRSSLDEGSEAPEAAAVAPLWADVPVDILATVLRLLPCLADRASLQSVCHPWRAAARVQDLPAPLPVLVLRGFRLSCLSSDGLLTDARRAPMPPQVAGYDVRFVGSSEDWLMAVRPSRGVNAKTDGECFLVNAFSREGKLYMVRMSRPKLSSFELREDEHGVSLSRPKRYAIDLLIIPSNPTGKMWCNMVVWRGKLLLIIRFFGDSKYKPQSVEVFALDFSTRPCGVTQIHNFDGDCIFVMKGGCRPFSAGLHVGVQGDLIYFSHGCIADRFPYAYNMRDGTVRHIAAGLPEGCIDFPIWIFPSS